MNSFNDNYAPISIDPIQLTDSYLSKNDWRTKENATSTFSIGALIQHQFGRVNAEYWLNKVYTREIAEAHRTCDFHIHDLSFLGAYCAGWSLQRFLEEGMNGVEHKIDAKPANHMFS
jgi:ribonucleoside-triphosphate reductase